MKKLVAVTLMFVLLAACGNNNPYDIPEETLSNVQSQIAETYLPKSLSDDYEAENIVIRNVCEAKHPMGNDNADYVFEYNTEDDEHSSDVVLYSDGEIGTGGQYEAAEGSCEEYQYQ